MEGRVAHVGEVRLRAARKAYDTIRNLAKEVDLTNDEAPLLASELARLKRELQTLGEVFDRSFHQDCITIKEEGQRRCSASAVEVDFQMLR